ncbi:MULTISPECIES: hypothetical protein [Flavobacterium]|uniref:hypothetical protein n=1 Tax=Flavobacterium TaxID=237 RepID=UPI001FCB0FC5|nr:MULTISPECIES: hypothetical protein [Flavobacterium]UOK43464.1 hypothetical protein LZF87_04915 [Flavobacterium enshiense]
MKILLLFSTFVLSCISYSQSNYKEYHSLSIKSQKTTKDSAIFYLEKAVKIAIPFPDELRNLSYYYFQSGNDVKAKEAFFKSIRFGYQFESDNNKQQRFAVEYDLGYMSLENKSNYGVFLNGLYKKKLNKMRRLRQRYLKELDKNDNVLFENILHNEKYFQELRFLFFDNKVKDSLAFNYIGKYGSTPNSYYMLELLKKGVFPKRRKCRRFNGQTITILLNHAIAGFLKKEDALQFVQMLWPLVEIGELTPDEYASAYDHYVQYFIDANKSLFGTKMYTDIDGKLTLMELINPNDVNQIRKEYWIVDIELFCKNFNIKLPKNYE